MGRGLVEKQSDCRAPWGDRKAHPFPYPESQVVLGLTLMVFQPTFSRTWLVNGFSAARGMWRIPAFIDSSGLSTANKIQDSNSSWWQCDKVKLASQPVSGICSSLGFLWHRIPAFAFTHLGNGLPSPTEEAVSCSWPMHSDSEQRYVMQTRVSHQGLEHWSWVHIMCLLCPGQVLKPAGGSEVVVKFSSSHLIFTETSALQGHCNLD